MTNLQPQDTELLKARFKQWDRNKLLNYAISLTQSMAGEQEKYKDLVARYDSMQTWLQALTLVEEIGQNLSATLDLDEVLTLLLHRVNEALDVEDGSILLTDELTGDLVFQISLGSFSEEIKPFRVPRGQGIAGEVALTGIPIIVDNAQDDSRHFKKIDSTTGFLTKSVLCVPLVTRDKITGVVEVFNKKSGPFTHEDQTLLSSIANYAAIAIENARLHQNVISERDRVITAQEEVSRKLQRDLHDGPTQIVAAIQMSIDFIKRAIQKDIKVAIEELDRVFGLAQKATHQMRTLLFELRPLVLETQGLLPALQNFLERHQKDQKTQLHLVTTSDQAEFSLPRLEAKVEMALFAIVQESVNNALKYAKADNIFVKLILKNNSLSLIILDDGFGFDLNKINKNYEDRGSYGMINIKERAAVAQGKLTLKSAPGAGTEIEVKLELSSDVLQKV